MKEAAEKAKMELSSTTQTDVNLPFITADSSGPKHLNIKLTRSKLEALVADLLDKLEAPCRQAMKDAGLSPREISEVILVGGMTRMPAVQERVKKIFEKEPQKGVNPDEVVAMGAAIQAGVLQGDVKDVLLLDVTPLSLGIETLGGVMTRLIDKNTAIPTRKSEMFSTAEDNQPAVSIHVLQGEREMARDNKTLGRFELVGISPAQRGTPQIEVTFDIDADGIVNVSAKDMATGKAQSIRITSSSGLTQAEIDRLVKEAQHHAGEDQKKRALIDAKNQADGLIYTTEKMLQEHRASLDNQTISEVESAVSALKSAMNGEDAAEITRLTEALNQSVQRMSSSMYQQTGAHQAQGHPGAGGGHGTTQADEDVVDADFEEVA